MCLMFSLPVGYSSASLEVATLEQLCLDAEERKESKKGKRKLYCANKFAGVKYGIL